MRMFGTQSMRRMVATAGTALLLLFMVSLLGGTAVANTIPPTFKLTGVGGQVQNGVYVAPYFGTINGGPTITVICNDYSHDENIGDSWQINISDFSNLSLTRWGNTVGGADKYREAAWLITQMSNPGVSIGDIQYAIWALFTAGVPTNSAINQWLAAANTAKLNGYYGLDFSSFRVLTPADLGYGQEFITQVPEPATLALLGSGLLAGYIRRKRLA